MNKGHSNKKISMDTSSEYSEHSESISTELISNVYSNMIEYRPSYLSKFEYTFFRFANSLLICTQNTSLLNSIFNGFLVIQFFSILCFPIINTFTSTGDYDATFKFVNFFINIYPNLETNPSPIFLYFLDILGFSTFFCFIFGFQNAKRKKYDKSYQKIFFSFFVYNLSQVLLCIFANYTGQAFYYIVIQKEYFFIGQTFISIIIFVGILLMRIAFLNTIQQSLILSSNQVEALVSKKIFIYFFTFAMFLNSFSKNVISDKNLLFLLGFIYIFFGSITFCLSLFPIDFHSQVNRLSLSLSTTIVISGIVSISKALQYFTGNYIMVIFIAFSFLAFYCIFVIIFGIIHRIFIEKTQKLDLSNPDFDSLHIANDNLLHSYISLWYDEAYPFTTKCQLPKWVLKRKHSIDIYYRLLPFSVIIPLEPGDQEQLMNNIYEHSNKTMAQKFILFRYFIISNFRNTSRVPPEMRSIVTILESRLTQFQSINRCFVKNISKDMNLNLLLIDSLATMKDLLYSNIKYILTLYPNSPEALHIYQSYCSKIENDHIKENKYAQLSKELSRGTIFYSDFNYVQTFSSYPKLQRIMLESCSTLKKPFIINRGSMQLEKKAKFFPSGNSFSQAITSLFTSHHKIALIVSTIFSFLFIATSIITIIFLFLQTFSMVNEFYKSDHHISSYIECLKSYFSFIFKPIQVMYRGVSSNFQDISNLNALFTDFKIKFINFSESTHTNSLNNKYFFRCFRFIFDTPYILPTYVDNVHLNGSIITYFSSVISALHPFFATGDFLSEQYILNNQKVFLKLIHLNFRNIYSSMNNVTSSSDNYTMVFFRDAFKTIFIRIAPFLFFLILVVFVPLICLSEIKDTLILFHSEQSIRNNRILNNFLQEKFYTKNKLLILYYISIFCVIFVLFLDFMGHIFLFQHFTNHINQLNIEAINLVKVDYFVSTSISSLFLVSLNNTDFVDEEDIDLLLFSLNQCIDFFTNGTYSGAIIDFSLTDSSMYQFVLNIIKQIDNNTIVFDNSETILMIFYYENIIRPFIRNHEKEIFSKISFCQDVLSYVSLCISVITSILLILSVIFFTIMTKRIFRLFPIILQLFQYQVPSTIIAPEKVVEILHKKFSLLRFMGYLGRNLLDLINKPCASFDKNNIIIHTNRLWLHFFNCSQDDVIGRSYKEFINLKPNARFITHTKEGVLSLIIIDEVPLQEELNEKIETLKTRVISLRKTSFPKRFRQHTEEGCIKIGFNINVVFILTPAADSRTVPERWLYEVKRFEKWIKLKIRHNAKADFLLRSTREISLLFGIDEIEDPHFLLLEALTFLFDTIRWFNETDWDREEINLYSIAAVGDFALMNFKKGGAFTLDINGPAFEKEMILREKVRVNSIVFCSQLVELVDQYKFGLKLDKIDDTAYIFSLSDNEFY